MRSGRPLKGREALDRSIRVQVTQTMDDLIQAELSVRPRDVTQSDVIREAVGLGLKELRNRRAAA